MIPLLFISFFIPPSMSASDRSLRFGPFSLDLIVSAGLNINQLMRNLLEVYTNMLAIAIVEQCPPLQVEDLKVHYILCYFPLCAHPVF